MWHMNGHLRRETERQLGLGDRQSHTDLIKPLCFRTKAALTWKEAAVESPQPGSAPIPSPEEKLGVLISATSSSACCLFLSAAVAEQDIAALRTKSKTCCLAGGGGQQVLFEKEREKKQKLMPLVPSLFSKPTSLTAIARRCDSSADQTQGHADKTTSEP